MTSLSSAFSDIAGVCRHYHITLADVSVWIAYQISCLNDSDTKVCLLNQINYNLKPVTKVLYFHIVPRGSGQLIACTYKSTKYHRHSTCKSSRYKALWYGTPTSFAVISIAFRAELVRSLQVEPSRHATLYCDRARGHQYCRCPATSYTITTPVQPGMSPDKCLLVRQ